MGAPILGNLVAGLRALLRRDVVERDMDEELRGYLESDIEDGVRRGLSREEASRRARARMGSSESVKEGIRSAGWEIVVEQLMQDLRYGLRLLWLHPTFAATAILSLALGIGANTAIFQLLDAVRMRTLPVKDAGEVARILIDHRKGASGNFSTRYSDFTYQQWRAIESEQQGFASVFAWSPNPFNISVGGEVQNVQGLFVSGAFFETLGVRPALGHLTTREDDTADCPSAGAVLSDAFWKRHYGGEPSVIGRTIAVNRHPFEIVGVAPAAFYGVEVGRSFDVALPVCAEPLVRGESSVLRRSDGWWLAVMGRLKPGWSFERASTQLRSVSAGIFESTLPVDYNPEQAKRYRAFKLVALSGGSGVSELRHQFEDPLWFLLGLAGLVLLIASANLANLMLARSAAREREMGMRLAVGASRGRLVRQLLTESLLIALIGAALGGLLARELSQIMVASLSTANEPLFMDIATDWRVLGFTAAIACLSCLLFGLTPALRAAGDAPNAVFKDAVRGGTRGHARLALRRSLVVTQIALSLMLLVGALLFARSLSNLAAIDAGFQQDGILVTHVDFTALSLPKGQRTAFGNALLERVRAIPGVESAGIVAYVPLSGDGANRDLLMGDTGMPEGEAPDAYVNRMSPGSFETFGTQ